VRQMQPVCPTDALIYDEAPSEFSIQAGALVVSTGYELMNDFPQRAWGGAAKQPNLITSLQMERMLAPHGPYHAGIAAQRRQRARQRGLYPVRRLPG
jgi:heterodisulfide reductase subunit A